MTSVETVRAYDLPDPLVGSRGESWLAVSAVREGVSA